jgi:hypothetical protein
MEHILAGLDGEAEARAAFRSVLHLVAGHQDHRANHPHPERAGNLLTLAVRAALGRSATEGEIVQGLQAFSERAEWKLDHEATMAWITDALEKRSGDISSN